MQHLNEMAMQALRTQVKAFETARAHNLSWAERADDPEIARAHIEIADWLVQTISQCNRLHDKYHNLPN